MVDGAQGISWTAIKNRLLVTPITPDAREQYQQDLKLMKANPSWDFDDAMAGRKLSPAEKRSLAAGREMPVDKY